MTEFDLALRCGDLTRRQCVDQSITELWLDGLATRDFEGTLRAFLGTDAPLSAATITRTNRRLMADYAAWSERRLDELELLYTWADGVYLGAASSAIVSCKSIVRAR